jgi:hypothetical protein
MSAPSPLPLASQFNGDELAVTTLSPDVKHDAALVICDRATDRDDARLLLEACGLARYEHGKFRTYFYGRRS